MTSQINAVAAMSTNNTNPLTLPKHVVGSGIQHFMGYRYLFVTSSEHHHHRFLIILIIGKGNAQKRSSLQSFSSRMTIVACVYAFIFE